jgi:hypothetical protein
LPILSPFRVDGVTTRVVTDLAKRAALADSCGLHIPIPFTQMKLRPIRLFCNGWTVFRFVAICVVNYCYLAGEHV